MQKLILGSQSPRRKEILSYFSLPFEQASPPFIEEDVPYLGDPEQYASAISKGKAHSLATRFPHALILTADTVVFKDGKVYGKPRDLAEAALILTEFSGGWHSVFTSVSLLHEGQLWNQCEETRVLFNPLTPSEISHYHSKLDWTDKAGGYTVQMAGGLAVRKIEGCYYNVLGLPINSVRHLLKQVNIDLWDYIR